MCRRCNECEEFSHHWIYSPQGAADDMMPDYACKHCNAIGDECGECHGDGCASETTKELVLHPVYWMAPPPCGNCGGEGVILVGGGDVTFERGTVSSR